MKRFYLFVLALMNFTFIGLFAQQVNNIEFANEKLNERGEFYFSFYCDNPLILKELSQKISLDNVKGNTVYAYATTSEFAEFLNYNIDFTPVYSYYDASKSIVMATTVAQMQNWDRYPTYAVYLQMMQNYASSYPNICKLDTIGLSVNNKPIVCLVISNNVNVVEDEPEFFWTSSMHGDETTGWIMLMRLADFLLSNYGINPQATNIVNHTKVYINPLSNPDGTFYNSSTYTSITNARRNNANNYDLNRNFPTVNGTSYTLQPEINIMINYATNHNFVMSANIHGGAEVFNFPWDAWTTAQRPHADDAWWQFVGGVYVNNVFAVSPSSYFTDTYASGMVEGGDWYAISGSRQDYMNWFQHCREVTLEISDTKKLDVENLNAYWGYNKQAMLDYTEQVLYGFRGIVTDACTGNPLSGVKVEISGHDAYNSEVYTASPVGNYHRPIIAGTYNVTFSKSGYNSKTITVNVINNQSTRLDVQLSPSSVANPNFVASQTYVPIGSTVNFTDQTTGTVSSRLWTFEQGNPASSTAQNPSVQYNTEGVFDVTLQIQSAGCTVNEIKTEYITVYIPGAPTASFTSDVTNTCLGIVNFINTSDEADSYLWDFGDNTSSTDESPTHVYTESGVFTVSLTATNAYGDNTYVLTNLITVNLPEAPTVTGASSCGPANLSLQASGSGVLRWFDAPIGGTQLATGNSYSNNFTSTTTVYVQSEVENIETYNVGPENNSIGAGGYFTSTTVHGLLFNAEQAFTLKSVLIYVQTSGNKTITLKNSSGTTIATKTVNITTGGQRVNLDFDIPAGSGYQLLGPATPRMYRNTAGGAYPYSIDGVVSIYNNTADDLNYYYYFYDWEIKVNEACVSARVLVTATINPVPNAVSVSGGGSFCGGTATLTATGGTGGTIYYQGTTSNGTSTSNPTSTQVVNQSGTYYFRAKSAEGCWGEQGSAQVNIYSVPDIELLASNQSNPNIADGSITINVTGGAEPYTYEWDNDLANGNPAEGLIAGNYCVTLTDANSCSVSDCIEIECENGIVLHALFTYSRQGYCGTSTFNFVDQSEGDIVSWAWDFGDGNSSTEQNPQHQYQQPGTYLISLTVANNGIENNYSEEIIVYEPIQLSFDVTDASSADASDGKIELFITGGLAPYNIIWSNNMQGTHIEGIAPGLYSVAVLDVNNCNATSSVNVGFSTHIDLTEKSQITLFPNPAENYISIISDYDIEGIQIIDVLGKVCYCTKTPLKSEIDISYLPKGIYSVNVLVNGNVNILRFVKE